MCVALCSLILAAAPVQLGALAPLEPYVGHCWVTQVSPETTDRHCFRPVYGGKHVRDAHVVVHSGQSVYEGETIYSAEDGAIVFTYFNSLGGVGRGTATATGGELKFELLMRATPEAKPERFETVWRRTPAGYDTIMGGETRSFRLDGE